MPRFTAIHRGIQNHYVVGPYETEDEAWEACYRALERRHGGLASGMAANVYVVEDKSEAVQAWIDRNAERWVSYFTSWPAQPIADSGVCPIEDVELPGPADRVDLSENGLTVTGTHGEYTSYDLTETPQDEWGGIYTTGENGVGYVGPQGCWEAYVCDGSYVETLIVGRFQDHLDDLDLELEGTLDESEFLDWCREQRPDRFSEICYETGLYDGVFVVISNLRDDELTALFDEYLAN